MKTYEELNAEFIATDEEINKLSLQLETLYAKRGELRDQLREASAKKFGGRR